MADCHISGTCKEMILRVLVKMEGPLLTKGVLSVEGELNTGGGAGDDGADTVMMAN